MEPTVTIGLDIATSVFQIDGVGAAGDAIVLQRLSRGPLSFIRLHSVWKKPETGSQGEPQELAVRTVTSNTN